MNIKRWMLTMFDYNKIKREHSRMTNKVLSEPTMVFDFLEIKEAILGMCCFIYFGIIETRPILLLSILSFLVFIYPSIRENLPRGFVVHKINRYTPIKIPNCFGINGKGKIKV